MTVNQKIGLPSMVILQSKHKRNFYRIHVSAMLKIVDDGLIANPFDVEETDLITLDTREMVDPEIVTSLNTAQEVGRAMRDKYVRERIEVCEKAITDTVPKANIWTLLTDHRLIY